MANRICLTCGNKYDYCGSCNNNLKLPVWKNIYDTDNCRMIFRTVSDYAQNAITKDVAKNNLLKCDLSYKFKDNITFYINDILAEETVEPLDETNETKHVVKKYNKNKTTTDTID